MTARVARIALIGLGEVGQTLAADVLERPDRPQITAWDRLFPVAGSVPVQALASLEGVHGASGMADALTDCPVVISAVTAADCVDAAREAAPALASGAYYLDLNSVSPASRVRAADHITAAGGRFVEAAVMSPIAPKRSASPILLGGPHAGEFLPLAHWLGLTGAAVFADTLGRASAAKMCRSIMIKGIEALLAESLASAHHHDVEQVVLDSLQDLFPHIPWRDQARYMISRSIQHGRRRADEMREAAKTAAEAGLAPWMSRACAERQDWAAGLGHALDHDDLSAMLEAMLETGVVSHTGSEEAAR